MLNHAEQATAPLVSVGNLAEEERNLRIQLAACYRLIAHFGWDELTYNHVSVRVPGSPDLFLTHRWGLLFDEVKASDLVKVNSDGEIVEGPPGAIINPAAFVVHSAVHEARHDINAVVHFHSVASVAVSSQGKGLLSASAGALFIADLLAYHDFEGVVLNLDERERLRTALGEDKRLLLLRNHGMLTCGRTIPEAFILAYFLNRACEVQIAALAGGGELVIPSETVRRHTSEQFRNHLLKGGSNKGIGELEFDALMRRLDRIDGSYRQ